LDFYYFAFACKFISFFSDKNCTVKVTDFKVKEILEQDLEKKDTNLTTLIYKRSVILALNTLKNRPLGWGIDGMDDATQNLLAGYNVSRCVGTQRKYQIDDLNSKVNIEKFTYMLDENNLKYRLKCSEDEYEKWFQLNPKRTHSMILQLNFKDGLSNFFKMFTEFGIFTFIILIYFIKYIRNNQNINPYNLFIIVLFITMCIRGAGYFNGGFIFCLLEFIYCKNSFDETEFKKNQYKQ